MTQDLTGDPDREERLNEALLTYVEARQSGREPDRRQFLASHPDLRGELEEFFASHDEVERLAVALREGGERAVQPRIATGESAADIGELGDFRLLREIGRGGMGVVYEAEQISLRRRVALKVLPFAAALDSRQLQRFKNEALAAAHLRHENIVPVYMVGEERGVHYYAMQFVEGQSLAHLIAELKRQALRLSEARLDRKCERGNDLDYPGRRPFHRAIIGRPEVLRLGGEPGQEGGPGAGACPCGRHRPPRHQASQSACSTRAGRFGSPISVWRRWPATRGLP